MENKIKTLQEIKKLLLKHDDFLSENPEILKNIHSRLIKGDDDDADKWLQENDPNFVDDHHIDSAEADELYDGYNDQEDQQDQLMDSPESEDATDEDATDEDAAYAGNKETEYQDVNAEEPTKEAPSESNISAPKKKKVSESGYRDWEPHGEYTPEQETTMKEFQDQGYSHREAERLANAHRGPTTFQEALSHRVRPSDMSPQMMGELKELTGPWLDNARRVSYDQAEAKNSPIKHTKGQTLKTHKEAMKDYSSALKEFRGSDEIKDMTIREKHRAEREWKKQYHADNPEYRNNLVTTASKTKDINRQAEESRSSNLQEKKLGIAQAGLKTQEVNSKEAAQHIGGAKTDEGYSVSTVKDPAAIFAEKHPNYAKSLAEKLTGNLSEEAQVRLKNINNIHASKGIKREPKFKIRKQKTEGDNNGQE
jgi:hypothetical protein